MFPEGEIKEEMRKRATLHDMDKIIMYQFMSREEASRYHKMTSRHHMANNIPKTYYDKLEAVLDYESAGYTKPDKPLNAFDTINRFKRDGVVAADICDGLLLICKGLGIARSYSVVEEDSYGMVYLSRYQDVTEDMIAQDVENYFNVVGSNASYLLPRKDIILCVD
jgi:hypothetical protein